MIWYTRNIYWKTTKFIDKNSVTRNIIFSELSDFLGKICTISRILQTATIE